MASCRHILNFKLNVLFRVVCNTPSQCCKSTKPLTMPETGCHNHLTITLLSLAAVRCPVRDAHTHTPFRDIAAIANVKVYGSWSVDCPLLLSIHYPLV